MNKISIKMSFIGLTLLLASMIGIFPSSAEAQQGRGFIRDAISKYGECRNVAITRTGGDLMLYGKNGYAQSGCHSSLVKKLKELHDDGHYIDDVQITENGRWVIIYDRNGLVWNNLPSSLESKMREYNDEGERIDAITMNDDGDWIVIGYTQYSASDSDILSWLKQGEYEFGELWTACLTEDAIVAVYANGFKTIGNVPASLEKALKTTTIDVYRLKIAGTAWFFADKNGRYNYNM